MRVPCWTLYRSVRDTTRPTDKTRTAIEKALLRIAVPHLNPFRFRPLLHHDVDFLSPAHTRDVHRDLCAAVERSERLIEEENLGPHAERSGEGDPLPLAARELMWQPILFPLEVDEVDHLGDPAACDAGRNLPCPQSVSDVVGDGEVRKEREGLVDDPDPAALGGQLANLLAVDEDLPRLGRQFTEDASEQRGLPAARGTQNRSQFAVLQSERNVLQNPVAVDGLLEPSDLEGRHSNRLEGGGGRNTCGIPLRKTGRGPPVARERRPAKRSWFLNPPTVPLPPRMTYSEAQAARVRKTLARHKDITEKRLFGGIAFLLGGNMCVGIHGDDLIVRIEPATTDAMLKEPGAKPFDLSGPRGMAGLLPLGAAGDPTQPPPH